MINNYLYDNIDNNTINLAFKDIICDTYISSGSHRSVYDYGLNHLLNKHKQCVVKIEDVHIYNKEEYEFSNIIEFKIWELVKDTTYNIWFAPCVVISNNGICLIQRKTIPLQQFKEHIPKKIPHFFTDVKEDNFGWLRKDKISKGEFPYQLVCHDYDYTLLRLACVGFNNNMRNFNI